MGRPPLENRFLPPTIETGRIVSVNLENWTVDVESELNGKYLKDIQVMSPYMHYINGEGMYCMPEVGSLVWICKPSNGTKAREFVLGFQAPYEKDTNSYRCGRQALNPGDIMFRTRDENFVILRRGGVVQIGSTPLAQRIFLPIGNFIKDFCENYQLTTLGGELSWLVDRPDKSPDGIPRAKLMFSCRETASDPKAIAELSIGSHGPQSSTTLDLVIKSAGVDGAINAVRLQLGKDGTVIWELTNTLTVTATSKISVTSTSGDLALEATAANISIKAGAAVSIEAATDLSTTAQSTTITSSTTTVDSQDIKLGGADSVIPVAKATALVAALGKLAAAISSLGGVVDPTFADDLSGIPAVTTKVK
jgi:hypothetical protein